MSTILKILCTSRALTAVIALCAFEIGSSLTVPTTFRSIQITNECLKPRETWVLFSQANEDSCDENIDEAKAKKSLLELFLPSDKCKVNQMSGTDLAYIGDVVFELFIRSRHVWPSKRTSDLQKLVVGIVRAEHQSDLLAQLKEDFPLTEKETQVLMRGRNAVTRSKNRRNPAAYQDSTSFEALIGHLFISDQERCTELLNWLDERVDGATET